MYRRAPAGQMTTPISIYRHWVDVASASSTDLRAWIASVSASSTSSEFDDLDADGHDGYGQVTTGTTAKRVIVRTMAKVEQLSGSEFELARQIYPKATYKVTVDYIASLDTTGGTRKSIDIGNKSLHIGAVLNPDLNNLQLELLCGSER